MADTCNTIRIVSSHPESQGPFVEINEEDFDAKKHKKYQEKPETAAEKKAREEAEAKAEAERLAAEPSELDKARAALTARGVTFSEAIGLEDLSALLEANTGAGWPAAGPPKAGE